MKREPYTFASCSVGTYSEEEPPPPDSSTTSLYKYGDEYMRENQQMHQLLFNLLFMYGGCYMFRHYTAFLRDRS
jgi:hypothetical protein